MNNVIDMAQAKNNADIETKQMAKFVILTMNEVIKVEQDIINDMEGVLEYYDCKKNAIKEVTPEDVEIAKDTINELDAIGIKRVHEAMTILNGIITTMVENGYMKAQGVFEDREIRKKYKELDNE